jgi:acyl phosphate:glycerol-3-phosphate acyltransferase
MEIFLFFLVLLAGYLSGSFPSSYIAGKLLRNIDIREHGSGNTGSTNVFRVMGPAPGAAVLLVDIVKGWAPVFYAAGAGASYPGLENLGEWLKIAAGTAAVCGHNWPVFLKFKGGKGVAVSVGALIGISPAPLAMSAGVWGVFFVFSGFVSLGSIAASAVLPLFMKLHGEPPEIFFFGLTVGFLIILRHRSNMIRLIRGRENRFNIAGFFRKREL